MKFNRKNFPKYGDESFSLYIHRMLEWNKGFEAELRQIEKKWKKLFGDSDAMIPVKEILGE